MGWDGTENNSEGNWMKNATTMTNGRLAAGTVFLDVQYGTALLRQKYQGVVASIVHITPAVAESYLTHNTKNRTLNKRHVSHLRDILEAGDMVMNGEAIIFSVDGTLLNGQHRLTACVESGVGFDALVINGIDMDAFKTIDGGRKRSTGDVLGIEGEMCGRQLAAAIQTLFCIVSSSGKQVIAFSRTLHSAHVCRILSMHPGIRDSVNSMGRGPALYRNQVGVALHYLFSIVSPETAEHFAEIVASGAADIERPFNLFRESLISTGVRVGDTRRTNAAKAIKAFNAELSGARPKLLRLLANEEFPMINGLDYESLKPTVH
jgi:hypothetical protein